jgi:hypothetical protein
MFDSTVLLVLPQVTEKNGELGFGICLGFENKNRQKFRVKKKTEIYWLAFSVSVCVLPGIELN